MISSNIIEHNLETDLGGEGENQGEEQHQWRQNVRAVHVDKIKDNNKISGGQEKWLLHLVWTNIHDIYIQYVWFRKMNFI